MIQLFIFSSLAFALMLTLANFISALQVIESFTHWRDMTPIEFSNWYSITDRCIISNSNTVQRDPRKVKKDFCNSSEFLNNENGKLFVGFGYSGKICVPPMTERQFFAKLIDGYHNHTSDILVRSLSQIQGSNRSLILLGDSMTGQSYDALIGELARLNHPSCRKISDKHSINSSNNLYHRLVLSKGAYDRIQIGTNYQNMLTVYMVRVNYIEKIENSTFYEGNAMGIWNSSSELIHDILDIVDGAVILANVGLWYNNRKSFQSEMTLFLNDLHALAVRDDKRITVLWRESTASHFDKLPNGYFKYRDSHHMHCVPQGLKGRYNTAKLPIDDKVDWRNLDVEELLRRLPPLPNLYLIRFHAVTVPLASMHLISRRLDSRRYGYASQVDCNHYCWMPTLWQPIWHALAVAVGVATDVFPKAS